LLLGDHVAGDAVQPADRRATVGPVAVHGLEQLDEDRRDRIGDGLRVAKAPRGEPDDLVYVPVVERHERPRVRPQPHQQLLICWIAQGQVPPDAPA
jgi:hypothetical protein